MLRIFLAITLCMLVPASALADPYSDLTGVAKAFSAVHSLRATETMPNGKTVTVEHVAPDKWHITLSPQMQEIMIGTDIYMQAGGRWMHIPSGINTASMTAMINHPWGSGNLRSTVTIQSERSGLLGGVPAKIFTFTTPGMGGGGTIPTTMWVGTNTLPMQAVVTTSSGKMTIVYSDYNKPITIAAP